MKTSVEELSDISAKIYELVAPLTLHEMRAAVIMALCIYTNNNTAGEGYEFPDTGFEEVGDEEDDEWVEEYKAAHNGEEPKLEDIEKESIRRALQRNGNSRKKAAEDLHMSERSLYRKMEKYGL